MTISWWIFNNLPTSVSETLPAAPKIPLRRRPHRQHFSTLAVLEVPAATACVGGTGLPEQQRAAEVDNVHGETGVFGEPNGVSWGMLNMGGKRTVYCWERCSIIDFMEILETEKWEMNGEYMEIIIDHQTLCINFMERC